MICNIPIGSFNKAISIFSSMMYQPNISALIIKEIYYFAFLGNSDHISHIS